METYIYIFKCIIDAINPHTCSILEDWFKSNIMIVQYLYTVKPVFKTTWEIGTAWELRTATVVPGSIHYIKMDLRNKTTSEVRTVFDSPLGVPNSQVPLYFCQMANVRSLQGEITGTCTWTFVNFKNIFLWPGLHPQGFFHWRWLGWMSEWQLVGDWMARKGTTFQEAPWPFHPELHQQGAWSGPSTICTTAWWNTDHPGREDWSWEELDCEYSVWGAEICHVLSSDFWDPREPSSQSQIQGQGHPCSGYPRAFWHH